MRILAEIEDCCRENLCQIADTSGSGERLARKLGARMRIYEKSACIVIDNDTEFTRRAVLKWVGPNVSHKNTSTFANHNRMPSSKASTAACAMSFFNEELFNTSERAHRQAALLARQPGAP